MQYTQTRRLQRKQAEEMPKVVSEADGRRECAYIHGKDWFFGLI